jgi:hypothetical protein
LAAIITHSFTLRPWTRFLAFVFLLFHGLSANARPTIAVLTTGEATVIDKSTFEAIIWHELQQSLAHEALFVGPLNTRVVEQMRRQQLTTLLEVDIEWKIDVIKLPKGKRAGGHFPIVTVREWAISGDQLMAKKQWKTVGSVALYEVENGPPDQLISIPEISLQSAVKFALQPVEAPVWRQEESWISIPVIALADEEYRAFYGESWQQVIAIRIARANAVLRPAGLLLDVQRMGPWVSTGSTKNLSQLLDQFASQTDDNSQALRIGFTQQTPLAQQFGRAIEDVGRAYLPGADLLIADQAIAPGQSPSWDIAEEGVAIAHEVLHALGVPHQETPLVLRSATKVGTVHRLSGPSIDLARAAASARYSHWDPEVALRALSHSAQIHLTDPEFQIDYIADNFSRGWTVEGAKRVMPGRLSALGNLALGHYYLRQAFENPQLSSQLTRRALAHTDSALSQNPSWVPANELRTILLMLRPAKTPGPPVAPPEWVPTVRCQNPPLHVGVDALSCE